jgi:hypothetical protein
MNRKIQTLALFMLFALFDPLTSLAQNESPRPRRQAPPKTTPKPLRDDIKVEKYLSIGPKAVRLLVHPKTGVFYYTDFDGGVYRIDNNSGKLESKLIFSANDHGITRLQGAVFFNDQLECGI